MKKRIFLLVFLTALLFGCTSKKNEVDSEFPSKLVNFVPLKTDAVFAGTGESTWDKMIRERGFVLKEGNEWRLWYTGYNTDSVDTHFLGLATSQDGINWKRYPGNPIYKDSWIEDMIVVNHNNKYYIFAEGRDDIMHWFTSQDGINWNNEGAVKIYTTKGVAIEGSSGTPTIWIEDDVWYLYYEKRDRGIWLAKSKDLKEWKNISDNPVITTGPDAYDKYAIAMDHIIKYNGRYYGYYHASAKKDWSEWTTDVAMSEDLINWKKYPGNPVIGVNKSSPVLVEYGSKYLLYTMHPDVRVFISTEE